MEEKLISLETAKLAKKKGFIHTQKKVYYNGELGYLTLDDLKDGKLVDNIEYAPTQSLLQKWLREKHGIHISLKTSVIVGSKDEVYYNVYLIDNTKDNRFYPLWEVEDSAYEDALENGLLEALKLI